MSPEGGWPKPALIGGVAVLAVLTGALLLRSRPPARPEAAPAQPPATRIEAVSALGRLEPAGDVRKLAAPISGMGGSPRLSALLVQEGDRVSQGQLLASFDNRPGLQADRQVLRTRIASLDRQLVLLERDTARYRQLARRGATAAGDLENREIRLLELRGQRDEARASLAKVETDLIQSELRAPIDGTVLRLHARTGERPGDDGILELGAGTAMEAVAEVYESDIARVRPGQAVTLTSENGGFSGQLRARVIRITPQVRQRQVLSTDPTGDADARVVEVRLAIDPADAGRVARLAGLKIIARFQP